MRNCPLALLSTSKVWQVSSKKTIRAEKVLLPLMFDPKELRLRVLEPPLDETLLDLFWFPPPKVAMSPERLMVLLNESNMASICIIFPGFKPWDLLALFRWPADVCSTWLVALLDSPFWRKKSCLHNMKIFRDFSVISSDSLYATWIKQAKAMQWNRGLRSVLWHQ